MPQRLLGILQTVSHFTHPILGSFVQRFTGVIAANIGHRCPLQVTPLQLSIASAPIDGSALNGAVFEGWALAVFLDIRNAYNYRNQEGIIYNFDFSQQSALLGLPIIPSLGIRGEL